MKFNEIMRKSIFLFFALMAVASLRVVAQSMQTYQFAEKDGQALLMDVYTPAEVNDNTVTILYIFGGGFIGGERNDTLGLPFCNHLAEAGFNAVAIDYRLGLKGVKNLSVTNYQPLENAINMAVEDAIDALAYLISHADTLRVNTEKIVLVGCSAGAITALHTDHALCNGLLNSDILPADFRLAGVASYAGAILTTEGKISYRNHAPAPTMFFHGTADKLVPYDQIVFFKLGFYGSSKLVKRFAKFGYPYYFCPFEGLGHSVAAFFNYTIDQLQWFVKRYVEEKQPWQVEQTFKGMDRFMHFEYDEYSLDYLYGK